MNCTEAKEISIISYLESIGYRSKRSSNGISWFCSPFRNESEPSLKVELKNNIWYDHGAGMGGTILDLVMKLNNATVKEALSILEKPKLSKHEFSFFQQQNSQLAGIEIKHVQQLQNRALLQYLESRKITPVKATNYLKESYYQVNGKQYFALAFENDLGGFELRNKYFKGSSSPKAITTIPGTRNAVNISEGFFDFLSALEYYQTTKPAGTCIILNSVSNLETIIDNLKHYQTINLYLDNDRAGELAAETIKHTHPKVKDYSKIIYPDYNDFNDFICKT